MEVSQEIVIAAVTAGVSFVGSWGFSQWRHNQQDKQNGLIWKEITKTRDAHAAHEKEANAERLRIHEQITEIRVAGAKTDEKFAAIMETLKDIKTQIAKFRGDDA